MEENVVMVTLGAEGGLETVDEGQGTSYMELKPSTTLLVPMELMEAHGGLVGCPQLGPPELHQAAAQDEPTSETPSGFPLMLDVVTEVNDTELPPLNDHLDFSVPPTLSPAVDDVVDDDEPVAKLEVILFEKEAPDAPVPDACEPGQGEEPASLVRADGEGSLAAEVTAQVLNTVANHEPEGVAALLDAELPVEEEEPAGLLMPEPSPPQELPEDVMESVAGGEDGRLDDENPETEGHHKGPEENGPVHTDAGVAAGGGAESAAGKKDLAVPETQEDGEEMKTETERKKAVGRPRKRKDVKKEAAAADGQVVEEPVEKATPSKATRRTTRGKSVAFLSPLPEGKEELREDEKSVGAPGNELTVSLRRTPRKSKQNQGPAVTPRRRSRWFQEEPPEEEEEPPAEAANQGAAVSASSKLSTPARRRVSQRSASSRPSQGGSQESSATEPGGSEDDVADRKPSQRSSPRAPTPSKYRTPQSSTPRRSKRSTLGSADVGSVPLEVVKEENEQEELCTSVKDTPEKATAGAAGDQAALLEVEEEEERESQASTPGRTTRHSSRNSSTVDPQVRTQKDQTCFSFELSRQHLIFRSFLSCYPSFAVLPPQSTKKMKRRAVNKNPEEDGTPQDAQSMRGSLRPKRGKLWDHPEEELPLLTSPLEVDCETPVADALIKRLQDEEEKEEGRFQIGHAH